MHANLFSQGHSRREVKDALNQHQRRELTTLRVLDFICLGAVLFLARKQSSWDIVALMVAAFTGISGLRYFVDQSVRNFYLHRLDWEETGPDPE